MMRRQDTGDREMHRRHESTATIRAPMERVFAYLDDHARLAVPAAWAYAMGAVYATVRNLLLVQDGRS
jgi:uncharacterized protein YndB with AHSA1/START domain